MCDLPSNTKSWINPTYNLINYNEEEAEEMQFYLLILIYYRFKTNYTLIDNYKRLAAITSLNSISPKYYYRIKTE